MRIPDSFTCGPAMGTVITSFIFQNTILQGTFHGPIVWPENIHLIFPWMKQETVLCLARRSVIITSTGSIPAACLIGAARYTITAEEAYSAPHKTIACLWVR